MPQEEKGEFLFVQNAFEEENKLLLFFQRNEKNSASYHSNSPADFPPPPHNPPFPSPLLPGETRTQDKETERKNKRINIQRKKNDDDE